MTRAAAAPEPTAAPDSASQIKMRAVTQAKYGTADTWRVTEVDRPLVGAREVLVEVRAAGLDRGTWHLMAGLPYAVRAVSGLRRPKSPVPGIDLAGTVVAVGGDVTSVAVGDEVFGIGKGTFAQFAVAPEDKLARKPSHLTFEQAAALPVSGSTALRAVTDSGKVEADQRVLVIGASGGVGSYAVQIAKARGAEVTGVCSAAKADHVRSLGADQVIAYDEADFADGTTKYDVIIDIAGNSSISRLRHALAPHGTLVIVGGEDGDRITGGMGRQLAALALSPFVGQRMAFVLPQEHYSHLERLTELTEQGAFVPSIERTFPLDEAAEAMRHLVGGNARGKLVITI
jgi:NADPH:quinone reductase-like Zn-dependent oxidoreductase